MREIVEQRPDNATPREAASRGHTPALPRIVDVSIATPSERYNGKQAPSLRSREAEPSARVRWQ